MAGRALPMAGTKRRVTSSSLAPTSKPSGILFLCCYYTGLNNSLTDIDVYTKNINGKISEITTAVEET